MDAPALTLSDLTLSERIRTVMEVFVDRSDAGRRLAEVLAARRSITAAGRLVVLAVPRGGLPVAAEVAPRLGADFDVAVVRRLRSPHNPEIAFGAVGPDGHVSLDEELVARLGLTREQVDGEVSDRAAALRARLDAYRQVVEEVDLAGALVVVVDDGVATGGTARGACALARRRGAARVVLAVPMAPRGFDVEAMPEADEVVVLTTPAEFLAVSQAYQTFGAVDDAAAIDAARRASART